MAAEPQMPDWHEIVTREGPGAWRAAYRIVGNTADADECFQEACLAALEFSRRNQVRSWSALVKRMAAARAIDCLRIRSRRRTSREAVECDGLASNASSPSQRMEDDELIEQLRAALAQIPRLQSELFCLHHLEEWGYQEIADELGMTTNRVGVLLHRARAKLAALLSTELDTRKPSPRES